MIYMMHPLGQPYCKIGYSNNPQKRLKNFQCNQPYPCAVVMQREGVWHDEFHLHYLLRDYHVRGEWFEYRPEVIDIFETASLGWMAGAKKWRRELEA